MLCRQRRSKKFSVNQENAPFWLEKTPTTKDSLKQQVSSSEISKKDIELTEQSKDSEAVVAKEIIYENTSLIGE